MRLRLLLSALTKYLVGVVMVGALVMLPAGSVGYWQGWLFMAVLFIPMCSKILLSPKASEKRSQAVKRIAVSAATVKMYSKKQ